MHDSKFIYFAAVISDPTSGFNSFQLIFDNTHSGTSKPGDDALVTNLGNSAFDDYFNGVGYPDDASASGTNDILGFGSYLNGYAVFEVRHPLCSSDTAHDFCLSPGSTAGFNIVYQPGNGAFYSGFPSQAPYDRAHFGDLVIPTQALTLSSPTIGKQFGAPSIPLNSSTNLSFTLENPNTTSALGGVGFTDSLPTGLVVSTPSGLAGSCGGGMITAAPGSGAVSLSGATIPATGSCTFSINVTGTTGGVKNNSVTVNSINGGMGNTGTASITVVVPPTISKGFAAASIPINGSTSLSFTINNPNSSKALSGVAFADTLPAGLVVSTPYGLTGSCGGTIMATAGSNTIILTGGTIAAAAPCTFSVNVTGLSVGTWSNKTGVVTSTEGGTGTTSNTATLTVVAPPIIGKAFGDTSIAFKGKTSLTFTIVNPAVNTVPLTNIGFTDNFPLGLGQIVVASPNGLIGNCDGGTITAVAGAGSVVLTGATLPVDGSCTFSVDVMPVSAGTIVNTVTATSANGGSSNASSATLTIAPSVIPMLQGWPLIVLGLLIVVAGRAALPAPGGVPCAKRGSK